MVDELSGLSVREIERLREQRDPRWLRANVTEVVRLAAIQAHAEADPFTFERLTKLARQFYKGRLSNSRIVWALLQNPIVTGDFETDALRLTRRSND